MNGLSIVPPTKPKVLRYAGSLPRALKNAISKHPILCANCQKEFAYASLLCKGCTKLARNAQRRMEYERTADARRKRKDTHDWGDNPLEAQNIQEAVPRPLPPRVTSMEEYERELARIFPFTRERAIFQKRLAYFIRYGPFSAERFQGRHNLGAHLAEALDLDPRLEHVRHRGGPQRWRQREGVSSDLPTAIAQLAGVPNETGDAHA